MLLPEPMNPVRTMRRKGVAASACVEDESMDEGGAVMGIQELQRLRFWTVFRRTCSLESIKLLPGPQQVERSAFRVHPMRGT